MIFEIKTENIKVWELTPFDFPQHLHHHIEIAVCTEGKIEVFCNEQKKIMEKGDVMIAFPNDIHSYSKAENGKGYIIIFNPNISEIITSKLNEGQYKNFVLKEEIIPHVTALHYHYINSKDFSIQYGYLHIIAGMIFEKHIQKKKSIDTNTFNSAIKYISLNYAKPLTLKELAKKIGVSQSHLSRTFSEKINGGFKNYLQILRIEKAKNLLTHTDMNIYEILMESGFTDQKTFNRVFKNITKTTPREYRRNHK